MTLDGFAFDRKSGSGDKEVKKEPNPHSKLIGRIEDFWIGEEVVPQPRFKRQKVIVSYEKQVVSNADEMVI